LRRNDAGNISTNQNTGDRRLFHAIAAILQIADEQQAPI